MSEANAKLIEAILSRGQRMSLGGSGIRLAADYVRGVLAAAGTDGTVAFPDAPGLLKDAESRLVYRNDDMGYDRPMTSTPDIDRYCKSINVQTPPRTLMVLECIVTSSKEDRDGDVLMSKGAIVDPKMPLLWHHMLPAVVGKMLAIREQNDSHVRVASAIMESPLGNDVANLIEFGALRISQGFRPLEFSPRDKGLGRGPKGFAIHTLEILEHSTVSVPSNTDAEIIAWSRGKVHTPVVKSWCKSLYDQRDTIYPSGVAKGGDGSGNFGHEGRPGEIGGSAGGEGGGGGESASTTVTPRQERLRDRIEGTQKEADREVKRADKAVEVAKKQLEIVKHYRDTFDADSKAIVDKALAPMEARLKEIQQRQHTIAAELETIQKRMAENKAKLAAMKRPRKTKAADDNEEAALDEIEKDAERFDAIRKQLADLASEAEELADTITKEVQKRIKKQAAVSTFTIPLEIKLDIRPTFDAGSSASVAVIQSAGPGMMPEPGTDNNTAELTEADVRAFLASLAVGDMVAAEEKTEADVAQDSQLVWRGWNGRVIEVAADRNYALIERGDKQTEQLEAGRRYRALSRQPEQVPGSVDTSIVEAAKSTPTLTSEDLALGSGAAEQAANGDNPPSWAVDEDLWEKAKEAAGKSYDEADEAFWAVVVHIYQNMGGTIQGNQEKAMSIKQAPDGQMMKCSECGEMVSPKDGKCPKCGAEMKMEKSIKTAVSAGQNLIVETIDGVSTSIANAVAQLNAATTGAGSVRAYITDDVKSFVPTGVKQSDVMAACVVACEKCVTACEACMADMTEATCKACAAACLACAKACEACDMPACDACSEACRACADACGAGPSDKCMATCKACVAACEKCVAACEKRMTKAGKVLSAVNEANLRTALTAIQSILEQVEPPATPGNPKPVAEPPDPKATDYPGEEIKPGPIRVDAVNPDGSIPFRASCETILVKVLGGLTADEWKTAAKLADVIRSEADGIQRAKRRESMRKLFKVRS